MNTVHDKQREKVPNPPYIIVLPISCAARLAAFVMLFAECRTARRVLGLVIAPAAMADISAPAAMPAAIPVTTGVIFMKIPPLDGRSPDENSCIRIVPVWLDFLPAARREILPIRPRFLMPHMQIPKINRSLDELSCAARMLCKIIQNPADILCVLSFTKCRSFGYNVI